MTAHEFINKAVDLYIANRLQVNKIYNEIKELFSSIENEEERLIACNINAYVDGVEIEFFETIMYRIIHNLEA